jgi:hypothetical protein
LAGALLVRAARAAGALRPMAPETALVRLRTALAAAETGVSVIIPSRNGRRLLEAQLPGIVRELESLPAEILVVDNGSDDGTAEWLRTAWPQALLWRSQPNRFLSRAP